MPLATILGCFVAVTPPDHLIGLINENLE